MATSSPLQRLAHGAGTGLRELPSNAAWVLSQLLPSEESGPGAGPRDVARRVKGSLEDAAPVGDSVETRMKRARAAAERAQQAEEEALAAAEESKRASDHARVVA
jgi:colicin import membrane protein